MSENQIKDMFADEGPGDAALGEIVSRHCRAELDGQLGRCAAAFRLHVLAERTTPRPAATRRAAWGTGPWAVGLAGAAVAASVALMVATIPPAVTAPPGGRGVGPSVNGSTPIANPPAVRTDRTVRTHLYDGGTFIGPDGRPRRVIRRLNVEENRWLNEATGEQVEQVVPSEEQMSYELKTY